MTLAVALVIQLAAPPPGGCTDQALGALDDRLMQLLAGDQRAEPGAGPARDHSAAAECVLMPLADAALRGWAEARRLAGKGGAPELLGPVSRAFDDLAALANRQGDVALEVEYAQVGIRAAVAAAQDEREEMALLLTHARDLSERLAARGRRAVWPRPYNLLAGDLWFEVDRYAEARGAFARAVAANPTPLALVGLARAEARLGLRSQACATWRRAQPVTPALRQLAAADLASCR